MLWPDYRHHLWKGWIWEVACDSLCSKSCWDRGNKSSKFQQIHWAFDWLHKTVQNLQFWTLICLQRWWYWLVWCPYVRNCFVVKRLQVKYIRWWTFWYPGRYSDTTYFWSNPRGSNSRPPRACLFRTCVSCDPKHKFPHNIWISKISRWVPWLRFCAAIL